MYVSSCQVRFCRKFGRYHEGVHQRSTFVYVVALFAFVLALRSEDRKSSMVTAAASSSFISITCFWISGPDRPLSSAPFITLRTDIMAASRQTMATSAPL